MSEWVKPVMGVCLCANMLGGCDLTGKFAKTGFFEPDGNGNITMDLGTRAKQYRRMDADGDGYTLKVGSDGRELVALAGIVPGTDPGAEVTQGTGTYYGTFVLGGYRDLKISGTKVDPKPMADAGTIVLEADFDSQTVSGTGTGISPEDARAVFGDTANLDILRGGTLRVTGEIQGREISGSVIYENIGGDLEGVIGEDQAIGVYHGKGGGLVYSGGFSTETDIRKVYDSYCQVNPCAVPEK